MSLSRASRLFRARPPKQKSKVTARCAQPRFFTTTFIMRWGWVITMKHEIRITLNDGTMSIKNSDGMNINDSAYMLLTATAATMLQGGLSRGKAVNLFNDAYTQAAKVLSDADDLPSN